MKGVYRFVKVGAACLVAVVLALAAAEVGFRLLVREPADPVAGTAGEPAFEIHQFAPYVVFQATPNVNRFVASQQQRRPGARTHVVTDRRGFRYDGDLDQPKRKDEIRVFLLGGSVVFRGLSNASTISGRLEALLAERLGGAVLVRCVNTGIVSAISDQELAVLVHKVADLEPDVVIAFDGFNDIWGRILYEPRLGFPFNWTVLEQAQRRDEARRDWLLSSIEQIPAWRLLLARSRLATRVLPGLALEQQLTGQVFEAAAEQHSRPTADAVADHFLRNWRKMHRITRGLGAEFLAILQPVAPTTRAHPVVERFYSRMNAEIEAARPRGEPFHSFDRLLDDRADFFYDEVHTRDLGHVVYAERMGDLLVSTGVLERVRSRPGRSLD